MSAPDSLSHLERRAWRSVFDDGLFDMLLGGVLLLLGIAATVPNSRVLYPFMLALPAVFFVIKWYIVLPRSGRARFGAPRRQRLLLGVGVLVGSTMAGATMTASLALDGPAAAWLRAHPIVFDAGFPLLVTLVLSALAALLDVARLHVTGLIMALGFAVQLWLDRPTGFLAGGAVLCLAGGLLFLRFLRRHPRLTPEEQIHAG